MIFGAINLHNNIRYQHHILEKISNHLSWPGSQSHEIIHESFFGVYLIDKRLPFNLNHNYYKDDNAGVIVFLDGFIYNQPDLLSELNIHEKTNSPELIKWAYEKWGITFADKLNGDFVIVIYLTDKNQVIIITDHMGIRPIAFAVIDSVLYFGTDAMGLSKALFGDQKIHKEFLLNMFLREAYDYTLLPQKNVHKLKPGHYIRCSSGQLEYRPYWHPKKIKKDRTLNCSKVTEDLRMLLLDAVTIRTDMNYIASAHISGGIDSGMVAVLSRKKYPEQPVFYGFSWSPEIEIQDKKINKDERAIVKAFCKQNNIIPEFTNYDEEDYLSFLSSWRHPSELIYERRTVKSAVEKGINLIFSGWGGDEFISIGDVGIDADLIREFDWNVFLKKYPIRKFRRFSSALLFKGLFPDMRSSYLKYKSLPSIYPYIRESINGNTVSAKKRFTYKSRRTFHLKMIEKYALAARTADWYVHGQRNGIEYRYPLLDKRIVEYMLKVPSRCLVNGNKNRIILRTIGQGYLPDEILNGFKDDPYNYYHFQYVTKNVEHQLIAEYHSYRNNPDLSFINFELLEKKLREYNNNDPDSNNKNDLLILHYLKKAHEFTKGYYSKNDAFPI